jgi:hypothetical protein
MKMFASDIEHKHHSQRQKSLSKGVKKRWLANEKGQFPNSQSPTIYKNDDYVLKNNSVTDIWEYKIDDQSNNHNTLLETQSVQKKLKNNSN